MAACPLQTLQGRCTRVRCCLCGDARSSIAAAECTWLGCTHATRKQKQKVGSSAPAAPVFDALLVAHPAVALESACAVEHVLVARDVDGADDLRLLTHFLSVVSRTSHLQVCLTEQFSECRRLSPAIRTGDARPKREPQPRIEMAILHSRRRGEGRRLTDDDRLMK